MGSGRLRMKFSGLGRAIWDAVFNTRRGATPAVNAVCLTMVKNEQDIIEPFLRHNRPYFDAMIVLDNGSTDRTRNIALDVAREIGSIFVSDIRTTVYDQGKIMSRAAAFVQSAFFADFMFFLDADEFLIGASPEDLHRRLQELRVGTAARLQWRTYLPDPKGDANAAQDVLKTITWRRAVERPAHSKVALRLGGQLDPRIRIAQGAHNAINHFGRHIRTTEIEGVCIAHLPVRSKAQLLAKGVNGWRANLARANRHPAEALQWKRLHDIYFDVDQPLSAEDIAHEALIYAQTEPFATWHDNTIREAPPIPALRRHSDGRFADPEILIAANESIPALLPSRVQIPEVAGNGKPVFGDGPPLVNIIETLRPTRVLDIGSARSGVMEIARQCGVPEVAGIDANALLSTDRRHGDDHPLDPRARDSLGRRFDLVICLDILPAVKPEMTPALVDVVDLHAKDAVLFAMPAPRRNGRERDASRHSRAILEIWGQRGWRPDLTATLGFRSLSTLAPLRRYAVVLRRSAAPEDAPQIIQRIAGYSYDWHEQQPGFRPGIFEEDYPDLRSGYRILKR